MLSMGAMRGACLSQYKFVTNAVQAGLELFALCLELFTLRLELFAPCFDLFEIRAL